MKLVAFDLYGTLLDFSGLAEPSLLTAWRKAQLERTWELNQMGVFEPFDEVTRYALAQVAPGLAGDVAARLCAGWLSLPAFPDAAPLLGRLRSAGVRTAILSNGTQPMIEAGLAAGGLRVDEVISVERVNVYKPDPRVYALVPRSESLFVSGNPFDADGARRAGLEVFHVDRQAGGSLADVPA